MKIKAFSRPDLSVLLIAKNEGKRLPALLDSLARCGLKLEVVILENGSTDKTVSISKKAGARVFQVNWQGYSQTKNDGIARCKAPWILSLDADEIPDTTFWLAVRRAMAQSSVRGFAACRLNYFLGRPMRHGGWFPDWQLRLFKKGSALFNGRIIHEGMEMRSGQSEAGRLKGLLHHDSYPSLTDYLERLNRYTTLQARDRMEQKGAKPVEALLRLLVQPPLTFFKMAVFKGGFLDGGHGWLLAFLSGSSDFWKNAKWWFLSWKALGGREGEPWVLKSGG